MQGDAIGGGTSRILVFQPHDLGGLFRNPDGTPSTFPFIIRAGQYQFLVGAGTTVFGQRITENYLSVPNPPSGSNIPLLPNSQDQAAKLAFAQRTFGPGGILQYLPNASGATLVGAGAANIASTSRYLLPFTVEVPTGSSGGAGGLIGLTKIAEDNSPFPRDRLIFNYDYFNGAAIFNPRTDVNRFVFGVEKTFFEQLVSLEVRLPFASTLENTIVADGTTGSGKVLFGNVQLILKGLLLYSERFALSAGLGVTLPTADDLLIQLADGTSVARINNGSVILQPFFSFLIAPNNRLFFQSFVEVDADPVGSRALANPDFTGLQPIGRLYSQSLLQIDAQLGYWLYASRDRSAWLRRVAPYLELHYNSTIGSSSSVTSGPFVIGQPNNHLDELNMVVGLTTQIADNCFLQGGVVLPLRGHNDRTFEYQIGIRANLFFGATARRQRGEAAPSTY
jgi:hypothetical protein